MFDFLSEIKREKVLFHHSLKPVLERGNFSLFLDNVRVFADELGLTNQEVEAIGEEIKIITSDKFKSLCNKIIEQAGFEVYIWTGGRTDLNDYFHPSLVPQDRWRSYRRAVHKLHGYYGLSSSGTDDPISTGIPFHLALRVIPTEKYQLQIVFPQGGTSEPIRKPRYGLIHSYSSGDLDKEFLPYPTLRGNQAFPNFIRCWLLCNKMEVVEEKTVSSTYPKESKVPREGLFGKLGFKKKIIEQVPVYSHREVIKSATPMKLSEIVDGGNDKPAYLMELLVHKVIFENITHGRTGDYPHICVIAGKELIEEIINFLLHHPSQYYNLLREFIPAKKFPNVNKCILSPPFLSTNGIVFEDYTAMRRFKLMF